jgi:hemerythrin-like domain-containing protein
VPLFAHDLTLGKARHSVAEHHELDELIEALDALSFGSSGWLNQAHSLFERIEHHLREEEREVFQLAGKALADADKLRLAKAYQREMREQREKRDAA